MIKSKIPDIKIILKTYLKIVNNISCFLTYFYFINIIGQFLKTVFQNKNSC